MLISRAAIMKAKAGSWLIHRSCWGSACFVNDLSVADTLDGTHYISSDMVFDKMLRGLQFNSVEAVIWGGRSVLNIDGIYLKLLLWKNNCCRLFDFAIIIMMSNVCFRGSKNLNERAILCKCGPFEGHMHWIADNMVLVPIQAPNFIYCYMQSNGFYARIFFPYILECFFIVVITIHVFIISLGIYVDNVGPRRVCEWSF